MKIISIVMLVCMVLLSNAVMAGANAKKPEDREFKQAKVKILKDVSVRLEIMNKYKSCVKSSNSRLDLSNCNQKRNRAEKALRIQAEKARAQQKN